MKSAGKARSNGLYRHIRTSKEIIRNLLNDYLKKNARNGFFTGRVENKMRLLVVEDEHSLREDIARKLRLSGYEVDACADGEAALEALTAERYDLVLLDLNLPKVDGMQVLRSLRQHDLETCVLILSARSEISDKVEGLDAGANDYLSKPFHLAELEARVRSLTRRKFIQQDVCLCCGRLSFNTRSRVATVDGQTLALTRMELLKLSTLPSQTCSISSS